jgi:septin family protein
MSYSADDFFSDNIALKMAELFKEYDPEKETNSQFESLTVMKKFIKILKDSAEGNGYEKFKREMLSALMNPHEEDISVDEAVADFLSMYSNKDLLIRKLEYSSGSSIISVDFQGLPPDDPS